MIILGVALLIIGFVTGIAIIWIIGIVVVIVALILALLGLAGPRGRRPEALLLTRSHTVYAHTSGFGLIRKPLQFAAAPNSRALKDWPADRAHCKWIRACRAPAPCLRDRVKMCARCTSRSRPTARPLAADRSLRGNGKARNLKALLRTSVAAFAIFADAHWGPGVFLFMHRIVLCTTVRSTECERALAKFSPTAIWRHD